MTSLSTGNEAAAPAPRPVNYEETRAGTYTLPDPLIAEDGSPVATAADWHERRRPELIRLFERHVYGISPPPPTELRHDVFDLDPNALGGTAVRKQVRVFFGEGADAPKQDILIYLPAAVSGPVPLILSLNFRGNHTVIEDPAVLLAMRRDAETQTATTAEAATRGSATDFDVRAVLARGYGFATIHYEDIEPDFPGGARYGVRSLFPEPGVDGWGAIGAWAYGLSRALDYLERDPQVDAARVAVLGHSRLGKTALWAAAQDRRIAMVFCSCSGAGGAALARRDYGETVAHITRAFPHWFCGKYRQYADRVSELPVDMHELIGLLAPRPVYITAAEDDRWADPRGMFLAASAAGPVYCLLGVQGLETLEMPALNQPVQHTVAYHYRTGKHEVTPYDWEQFLAFADRYLRNPTGVLCA